MRPRDPHPQRHPRGGGDPGHCAKGARSAASTVVAARARALSVSPRRTVTWIPAFAGMTKRREGPRHRRDRHDMGGQAVMRPRDPHPQRHPRGGGDPGHLSTGATPAASTVVAAWACASSASPRRTVTWIPAFAGMTANWRGRKRRPSPLRGGVGGGGDPRDVVEIGAPNLRLYAQSLTFTPPLTPPRQGEGNTSAIAAKDAP
jgi:hypothetical protein